MDQRTVVVRRDLGTVVERLGAKSRSPGTTESLIQLATTTWLRLSGCRKNNGMVWGANCYSVTHDFFMTRDNPMDLERVGKYWPETLSIVRIVVGLLFLEHGSAKLLGFPTPPNPAPAMMTLLWTQGVIELVGGLLLAIGLFTRPVALILAGDMAVAYFMAHAPKNFFPLLNGGDAAILYCFIFLLFFAAGPGRWSIDRNLAR
jgi:putative oxidoreductase